MVTLTFRISDTAADGDYNIGLTYASDDFYNDDVDEMEFTVVDGTIKVR